MATSATGVLTPADLNDTDDAVLDVLRGGRVTPQYAADQMDVSRTYASERLKRLVEHKHVAKVAPGLYELVDDPRDDVDSGGEDTAALEERVAELERERDELEAQIESALEWAEATLDAIQSVNGDEAEENAETTVAVLEGSDGG